ncbi:MAG TPA: serine--tRNA ligase, partial [Lacunisphaera sp.]
MLDPKLLRESPETVRTAIARKHLDVDLDAVLALDKRWREHLIAIEKNRADQGRASAEMAALPKNSPEFQKMRDEMKEHARNLRQGEVVLKEIEAEYHAAMLTLPNIPHATVPDGKTPEQNVVHATYGSIEAVSKLAVPHWEISGFGNLIDFPRGAKVTGAGFPFFIGEGAKLSRALLQFFLDEDVKAGYTEVSPPIFVNAASA